jgi:uncharacterized alkaline shock family protein YloU
MSNSFYLSTEKNKHIPTSRNNIRSAIKEFLLYMSNDDIELIEKLIQNIKTHRIEKKAESDIEVKKHSLL